MYIKLYLLVGTKEDRRRIVQLLQLAEPVENSMKMYYDRRPETTTRTQSKPKIEIPSSNSVSLRKCTISNPKLANNQKRGKSQSKQSVRKTPSDARQNIVKTIMMCSNTKENFATDENMSLKKQKEELTALYENIIMKIEEDGRLREEEFRLQANNMNAKLAELKKRKKKLDDLNYKITKDFLEVKYDTDINNKKLNEENNLIKMQNQALENSLKDIIKKASIEREANKNEYARKTKEVTNSLRKQVRSKEDHANLVKEQYKQVQKIYADKVNELETKLSNLTDKHRMLESQQDIKVDNYLNEIIKLRKHMKLKEKYVSELKKMGYDFVDNYDNINNFLNDTSQQFFNESNSIDNSLAQLSLKLENELRNFNKLTKNGGIKPNDEEEYDFNNNNEDGFNQNNNIENEQFNNNINNNNNFNDEPINNKYPNNQQDEQFYQGEEHQYDPNQRISNSGNTENAVISANMGNTGSMDNTEKIGNQEYMNNSDNYQGEEEYNDRNDNQYNNEGEEDNEYEGEEQYPEGYEEEQNPEEYEEENEEK